MKTILFLDRSPLTILYSKMTPYLDGVKFIHVAYSQKEVEELASYNLKPDYVYLELFKNELDGVHYDDDVLKTIDTDIVENTNGRFNLNGAIQSDRGFSLLDYEESLQSAVAHYSVWSKIFKEHHVDMILHEPCSLFLNFIGCVLCKKQGGYYTYQIASMSDRYDYSYLNAINDDFIYPEIQSLFKKYLLDTSLIDTERCNKFLDAFREKQEAFFGDIMNQRVPFLKLCRNALVTLIKNKAFKLMKASPKTKLYDNITYWLASNNVSWKKIKNLLMYNLLGVKFENIIPEGERYYFYPFHLEPEAVVLYLGGGLYSNQVKLIENIAASLPAGYFLYVKDHPHEYAYRDAIDYKRLMQIPNIRLLNQNISSKAIISKALGVITINGTAGFEAMLLNKQVYCFGHNMYSFVPRVNYINHIKDLKNTIYNNINKQYRTDEELLAYVMAYLESSHKGYTACYSGGIFIKNYDYEENAKVIAADIVKIANQIEYL